MNKINISHVNNMHNQWLRTFSFYKTEIAILSGILTEVAGKNTGIEMLKEVEHYENQFRLQTENIDTVTHGIRINIDAISREASTSSTGYIDATLAAEHTMPGKKTETLEKSIADMIRSFRRFAGTWM